MTLLDLYKSDSDSRVTNISKKFTYKMAAKASWHRCGTKYVTVSLCITVDVDDGSS